MSYIILFSLLVTYGIYRLVRAGMMQSRWSRFFGMVMIATVCTLTNLGPIGLLLGGPSILMTAMFVSLIFDGGKNEQRDRPEDKKAS